MEIQELNELQGIYRKALDEQHEAERVYRKSLLPMHIEKSVPGPLPSSNQFPKSEVERCKQNKKAKSSPLTTL